MCIHTCADAQQAEANGGGLALWGSDGRMGNLRTSDEAYHKAWTPYVNEVAKIIAANQITEGGVSAMVIHDYFTDKLTAGSL